MTMATTNDYPSYLPEDFKGLDSIQEGNQRYYFKREDGKNLLYGSIVGKRHMVIRYPEGSTIDVPPNSVGTEQLKDGAVEMEDLHNDVQQKLNSAVDQQTMTEAVNAAVGEAVPSAVSEAMASGVGEMVTQAVNTAVPSAVNTAVSEVVKEAGEESIRDIVKDWESEDEEPEPEPGE